MCRTYNRPVLVSDFDFHLPPELIAQHPPAQRGDSRMLRLNIAVGSFTDLHFSGFPQLLRPGDLLVFNDTKVIPARLFGRRSGTRYQPVSGREPAAKDFLQGRVEVLLTRQSAPHEWQALVRPGKKVGVGEVLNFGEGADGLSAEVTARGEFGERTLRFAPVTDFFERLHALGHIPLPPYIGREDSPQDRERYQTIFAQHQGSVAAPTAGLHFTPEMLARISADGIDSARLTLHVGLGTFQPLRHETVEENVLHAEPYTIPPETAGKIAACKASGGRVVAVGTTTVRTLEFVAQQNGGKIVAGSGEAQIFIYPGFHFKVTDALLTNFHLPKSSLLMLVSAFAGGELTRNAYQHAVAQRYRFFSYGDCMFIERD